MAKSYTRTLFSGGETYRYVDISRYAGDAIASVPYSLRVLLENLMRHADDGIATEDMFNAVIDRKNAVDRPDEVPFHPARVLMQDFTGVPAVVDLASLRDAVMEAGKDPKIINPQVPVDLVVDHSVQIDSYGKEDSRSINVALEYQRNHERYSLLKWAQESFSNLRIVPPNSGICHQVNLEYLADCVRAEGGLLFPDSLVGTDSHTTMINGLGVSGLPPYSTGYVNWLQWILLVGCSIPMAIVGAKVAHLLPAKQLKYIFIAVMFYMGLKMIGVFSWLNLPL